LKSLARSDPSFTFRLVTAFFFSWGAPTELFGTIIRLAAWPSGVAPRTATASAVMAMTVGTFERNTVLSFVEVHALIEEDQRSRPGTAGGSPVVWRRMPAVLAGGSPPAARVLLPASARGHR
jgi:hypothetical protein